MHVTPQCKVDNPAFVLDVGELHGFPDNLFVDFDTRSTCTSGCAWSLYTSPRVDRCRASVLDYGILQAETARAPIGIAIPLKSLGVLFPNLWPEVDTD